MKKILITGENSYIGTSFEKWVNRFPNDYLVETISTLGDDWKSINFSKYDVVLNVAGIAHVDAKPNMEGLYYKVNRDLAIALAEKAKKDGVHQYIFISSMIVFSNLIPIITKDTVPNPRNFYGKSKLQADEAIQKMNCDTFKVVSIRPCMVYGPNCKGNFTKLSLFARKSPLFPNYNNKRSMIFIDNLCEFIKLMVDNDESGIFYPQNKEYVCTTNTVKAIAKFYNKRVFTTKLFNPIINMFLQKINILNKVFGDYVYSKEISNYKDFSYCVVDFEQSIILSEKR